MDLFHWIGVVVVTVLALGAAWLVAEWVVGICASVSWHRWALKSPTKKFRWLKHSHRLLWSILSKSWEFYGYRNDGSLVSTHIEGGGSWRGIGDWEVGPRKLDP